MLCSCGTFAAVINSVGATTLTPAYKPARCALVTSNGYAGTDRHPFMPPVDGYYSIKAYTPAASNSWLIAVDTFDPNQRLVDQALAVGPSDGRGSYAAQAALAASGRYLAWAAFTGGYDGIAGCQPDGVTETVDSLSSVRTPACAAYPPTFLHHQPTALPTLASLPAQRMVSA